MCGIVGIYEYGRVRGGVSEPLLRRMRETLAHRGPDGAGQWISDDQKVGLAVRRLAILDPIGGSQPMVGSHGEVIVFNGEIYNFLHLRRDLEHQGVHFRTTCDTEIVLRLYELHGIECVSHLNGMFAIAIWDPRNRTVFLARDRVGEKPLYWADISGVLLFGSEIKALLEHPLVTPSVNEAAIGPYLTNLVTTPPDTLYAGIHKLGPGVMAMCGESGIRTERWWDLFRPRRFVEPARPAIVADTLQEMLKRSVQERMLSDRPVGVLLSGGLDSTALVALLGDKAAGRATFSVGYEDHPELDEREHARRVAAHFGTQHHEVTVGVRDAIAFLPRLIHHQDEPLADPVCIPLAFVCALARANGVPVVLAGEGSDELFWGYPRYRHIMARERWLRAAMRLPPLVRRAIALLVPPGRLSTVRQVVEGFASGRPLPIHMPLGITRHHRARVLLDRTAAFNVGWMPSNASDPQATGDVIEQLILDTQEYEFGLRLPELLLMRIDRFSMANGVEARVPFLDPDLVEYVYRLPLKYKLSGGTGKVILREALRGVVPAWVIERRKQGFGAPVVQWLASDLGPLFLKLLETEGVRRYFDAAALRSAMATSSQRSRFGIWPILNFALWHRYWIEQEPLDPLLVPLLATRQNRAVTDELGV